VKAVGKLDEIGKLKIEEGDGITIIDGEYVDICLNKYYSISVLIIPDYYFHFTPDHS